MTRDRLVRVGSIKCFARQTAVGGVTRRGRGRLMRWELGAENGFYSADRQLPHGELITSAALSNYSSSSAPAADPRRRRES